MNVLLCCPFMRRSLAHPPFPKDHHDMLVVMLSVVMLFCLHAYLILLNCSLLPHLFLLDGIMFCSSPTWPCDIVIIIVCIITYLLCLVTFSISDAIVITLIASGITFKLYVVRVTTSYFQLAMATDCLVHCVHVGVCISDGLLPSLLNLIVMYLAV